MSDINTVTISGRLARDPEFKQTNGGTELCRFAVGSSDWVNKSEYTNWFNCIAWGRQAQTIHNHFKKGSKIFISGKLRHTSWEHEGKKNYKTEIIVLNFSFGDSKNPKHETTSDILMKSREKADESDIPF